MSASNWLEDQLLAATLTGATFTGNATVYAALYSTAPSDSSAGTELTGSSYARVAAAFTVDTGNSRATNSSAVTFGPASANWLPVVATGIFDAATGGNLLYFGSSSPIQTVLSGNSLTYPTGNLVVTMD
jgi:hypothetical protein